MRAPLLAGATVAGLLATGCSDDAAQGTAVPDGPTTQVIPVEVLEQLPVPSGDDGGALGLTAWDGEVLLVGPAGGVVAVEAGGDDGAVDAVAAGDDTLLALGHDGGATVVWRSSDSERWERLDAGGLDGAEVTGLTADPDGGFIAYGQVAEDDQTVLTLWRSDDGAQWEVIDTPGLDQVGDAFVASREAEGLDDSTLTIVQGERDGDWVEVETSGLEPLDLPNSDVLAPLARFGEGVALFGSLPVVPDEEFGERQVSLFTSDTGERWTAAGLDGPGQEDPLAPAELTEVDGGVAGLTGSSDGLVLWWVPS
jgi:hypothetical protein